MKRWNFNNIFILIMILPLFACTEEVVKEPMDEVTVQLAWRHQSQFAGFYAAELKGYYESESIKVDLREKKSPTFEVVDSVVKGDADFGVTYGIGILKARSDKYPATAIASIYQHYPLVFMSLEETGISHPLDFIGKKFPQLTPGGASIVLDVLLKKNGISESNITFVPANFDFDRFLQGEIDVWAGYVTNELVEAPKKGYRINQIRPGDHGINLFGDTLFTSDILLNTNPDLVLRFVRATIRGWQWAIKYPEEAARMALQYDSTLELNHQVEAMKASIPYLQVDMKFGMMGHTVWNEMYNTLLEQGVIEVPFNINLVYTNAFVEEIYREP